jgi:hypothetical protein
MRILLPTYPEIGTNLEQRDGDNSHINEVDNVVAKI